MDKIKLGNTGLEVSVVSFGALPVQRLSEKEAARLIREAYEGGINYFDTANAYSDSEKKLGLALSDVRDKVVISTKTAATDRKTALAHIENSLKALKTDYIDLIQLHNPKELPDKNDGGTAYAALVEAKKQGYVRHIGLSNHSFDTAKAAIVSGDYETLQYPFSYISAERELALPALCAEHGMGFIAMKGLCGGMLTDTRAAFAFMRQYPNVVPIWGIQSSAELTEWLSYYDENPVMNDELKASIQKEKAELAGEFCRACGYCLPCTAGIIIPTAARMRMLLRRAPYRDFFTPDEYENMQRINDCVDCGACMSRCPYGLDTPRLLRTMLRDYNEFFEARREELEPLTRRK